MIKGKSKIELKNIKTGEVKIYENENMITDLFDILPSPMNFYSALSKFEYPIWKNVFGGILIFNKYIDENTKNIIPFGNNQPFACAGNNSNTTERTDRGSFNETESGIQSDGSVKMVWDFATSQANGPINALALTTAKGGMCGYGSNENVTTTYKTTLLSEKINLFYGSRLSSTERPLIIDYDNNKMYLWSYVSDKQTNIEIKEYDIALNKLKLNTQSLISTSYNSNSIQLNNTLQSLNAYYMNTTPNGKAYFYFSSDVKINNSSKFYILEIDLFNNYTNKVYEITNNTVETLQLGIASSGLYTYSRVHGDYLYCQSNSTYNMYKIKLVDNTDVVKVMDSNGAYYEYMYVVGDFMYMVKSNEALRIYNFIDDSCKYMNECSGMTFNNLSQVVTTSWAVPIIINGKESPFFWDINSNSSSSSYELQFLTNFMFTINNLATEINKTADNTMKITYTLTQV